MAIWHQFKTKKDYKMALDRIDELMDIPRTESVQNELTLISYLVEEYENKYYPMPDVSPQEVIRFMLEMKGMKQKDLIPIFGTKGHVSKILNGSRKIQLEKISELSTLLGIPAEALIPKLNDKIFKKKVLQVSG